MLPSLTLMGGLDAQPASVSNRAVRFVIYGEEMSSLSSAWTWYSVLYTLQIGDFEGVPSTKV